jgi:hypothetical protein
MVYLVDRKQLFAAPKFQGVVLLRAIIYWSACIVVAALMLLGWRLATGPAQTVAEHISALAANLAPALVAALLVLPVIVIDTVSLSNRFFGPLARLQGAVRRLARGERVVPIHFREDDFWHEFATEFNELVQRVETLETEHTKLDAHSSTTDEHR